MTSSTMKEARLKAREVADRASEQVSAADVRDRLAPVVEHALQVAREQAAHAAVAAGAARDWAAPRLEAAVERGLQAAAPTAQAAAERVAPAVDAARDRLVDELLPRLVEAVQAASAAGLAARANATESVSRSVEDAARAVADATPTAKARRRRSRARFLWIGLTAAALAAAFAALRRRGNRPTWETAPTGVAADVAEPVPVATSAPSPIVPPAAAPVAPVTPITPLTPLATPDPDAVAPSDTGTDTVAEPVPPAGLEPGIATTSPEESPVEPTPAEASDITAEQAPLSAPGNGSSRSRSNPSQSRPQT